MLLVLKISDQFAEHLQEIAATEIEYLNDDQIEGRRERQETEQLTHEWTNLRNAIHSQPWASAALGKLLALADYVDTSSDGQLVSSDDYTAMDWARSYCQPAPDTDTKERTSLVAEDVFDLYDCFIREVPIFVRIGQIDQETSKELPGQHYRKQWWVQVLDCEDTCQHGMSSINGMSEYVTQIWHVLPDMLSAKMRREFPKEPIAILWLDQDMDIIDPRWQYDPTHRSSNGPGWHATHTRFEHLRPELVKAVTGEDKPE